MPVNKVLVYGPREKNPPVYNSLDKVLGILLSNKVVVSSQLEEEVRTMKYGLVIDTSSIFEPLKENHIETIMNRIESTGIGNIDLYIQTTKHDAIECIVEKAGTYLLRQAGEEI